MASEDPSRDLDPRVRQLVELNESLRKARQALSPDTVRKTLLDSLHHLGFDRVTFLGLDSESEQLRALELRDPTNIQPDLSGVRFPLRQEEPLLARCRQGPGAFRLVRGEAGSPVTRLHDFFAAEELCVMPLFVQGELAGLVVADNVFSRRPIPADAVPTLEKLSAEAGLAMEHSQLLDPARDGAAAEDPSMVLNRRRILEKVTYEMGRARRYDRPLSVALFDVDQFEAFRETFGHMAGDSVLEQVAGAIKQTSREVDHVGRCGPELFLAVLPETGAKNVLLYAERVRVAVERLGTRLQTSYPRSILTLSAGVASFEREIDGDAENLMGRVRRALEEARAKGPNCCVKA